MKICDEKALWIQETIEDREERNNIKYYRDWEIFHKGNINIQSINEIIRSVDIINKE